MVKHSSSGRGETQRPRDIQKLARSKTSTKRRMLRAEKNEGIPQAKAPTPQPKKTKKKSKAGVARRKKKSTLLGKQCWCQDLVNWICLRGEWHWKIDQQALWWWEGAASEQEI